MWKFSKVKVEIVINMVNSIIKDWISFKLVYMWIHLSLQKNLILFLMGGVGKGARGERRGSEVSKAQKCGNFLNLNLKSKMGTLRPDCTAEKSAEVW